MFANPKEPAIKVQKGYLRIPDDADQRSGMKPITVPF